MQDTERKNSASKINEYNYKPVELWTIYSNKPVGLYFLAKKDNDGSIYRQLSYPVKVVGLIDTFKDIGFSEEEARNVTDKLVILEDGSEFALSSNQIFNSYEEAKQAFISKINLNIEIIEEIKALEQFLLS